MKKLYCAICGKCRKFEKAKISYILEKPFTVGVKWRREKYLKKKNQLRYYKFFI